jgi:spermidine synthase
MLVFCDGCVNHGFHFDVIWIDQEDCFAMAKRLFFKQATELNKNQVPARGCSVFGRVCFVFGKVRFINVRNFCIVVVLYPNYFGCIYS